MLLSKQSSNKKRKQKNSRHELTITLTTYAHTNDKRKGLFYSRGRSKTTFVTSVPIKHPKINPILYPNAVNANHGANHYASYCHFNSIFEWDFSKTRKLLEGDRIRIFGPIKCSVLCTYSMGLQNEDKRRVQ